MVSGPLRPLYYTNVSIGVVSIDTLVEPKLSATIMLFKHFKEGWVKVVTDGYVI